MEKPAGEEKIKKVHPKKRIEGAEEVNLLPLASQEDLSRMASYFTMDHVRMVIRIFLEKVGRDIKSGNPASLVDVGCRNDKLRPVFSDMGFSWVGLDPVPDNGGNIIRGFMEDMPFGDESFDVCFSSHSFEHSDNPVKSLKEMKRITRMGGLVFIATPMYCEHQLMKCDQTHIFVPTKMQMERLLYHVGLKPLLIEHWNVEGQEDRFANLITIAKVVGK